MATKAGEVLMGGADGAGAGFVGCGPVSAPGDPRPTPPRGDSIATPVHVDSSLPVHRLTTAQVGEMLRAGIIDPDDRIELLDGVLVEISP